MLWNISNDGLALAFKSIGECSAYVFYLTNTLLFKFDIDAP